MLLRRAGLSASARLSCFYISEQENWMQITNGKRFKVSKLINIKTAGTYLATFMTYLILKNSATFKSEPEVTQDHQNWYVRCDSLLTVT